MEAGSLTDEPVPAVARPRPRAVFDRTVKRGFVGLRGAFVAALERRTGIDTAGEHEVEELGLGVHDNRYKPSGWLALRRALPLRSVGPDDVFLDLGCGKGRVVCQAALRYPFARVIGVDASHELLAAARANVDRLGDRRRTGTVEIVHADVREYEVPDDVTVVYLYNPFFGPVFDAAVRAMVASQDRRPRPLRVIYATPVEEDLLTRAGFRVVRHLRGMRPGAEWARSNATLVFERR